MNASLEIAKVLLSPPGDTIRETLDVMEMSQAELAERMGRAKEKVNDMIKGRAPISQNTAFQLEKVLGVPATFWLNREKEYRRELFVLQQKENLLRDLDWARAFPVNQMRKHGWLPTSESKESLVNDLLKFFGVASPKEWSELYLKEKHQSAFRVSLASTVSPHAVSAWLRMGELHCGQQSFPAYDKKAFTAMLKAAKKLAWHSPVDFHQRLQVMCHDCGVALVYTPKLPKAPISGASRWFRQTPLIQLSDRFKTADQFWFSFFHEAAHIILHGKKDIFLEDLKGTPTDKNKEEEANNYAAGLILPETELQEILASQPLTTERIRHFANKFCVPASIILGRLQHLGVVRYSWGNELKQRIKLFDDN